MAGSGMLTQQFSNIDRLRRELEPQALRIIAEIQDTILDLNKEQLEHGLDSKGQKLKPKYVRIRYAKAKNSVNPLPGFGTPDLKLTGRFRSNFYLTATKGGFSVFSSDEKTPKLTKKYGNDIFGLERDNEDKINQEEIYPRLLEWILKKL